MRAPLSFSRTSALHWTSRTSWKMSADWQKWVICWPSWVLVVSIGICFHTYIQNGASCLIKSSTPVSQEDIGEHLFLFYNSFWNRLWGIRCNNILRWSDERIKSISGLRVSIVPFETEFHIEALKLWRMKHLTIPRYIILQIHTKSNASFLRQSRTSYIVATSSAPYC